jgi:hypothetical protein
MFANIPVNAMTGESLFIEASRIKLLDHHTPELADGSGDARSNSATR